MSDAPEKIWAWDAGIQPLNANSGRWTDEDLSGKFWAIEYTRSDIAAARIEALEAENARLRTSIRAQEAESAALRSSFKAAIECIDARSDDDWRRSISLAVAIGRAALRGSPE